MATAAEPTRTTAVIADAHPLWLDAEATLVEQAGIEVVARARPGREALRLLGELRPDVFITELAPTREALAPAEYVAQARMLAPTTKVIVLSAHDEPAVVGDALANGAKAYVIKTAGSEDVAAAIRLALDQSVFLAADVPLTPATQIPSAAVRDPQLDLLTPREVEILRLVSEGLTNGELARRLWLSEQTVKFHLSNIYRKVGASNRTEASRWAQLHGVLTEAADPADPTPA